MEARRPGVSFFKEITSTLIEKRKLNKIKKETKTMTETRKTESTSKEESQASGFNFPFGNFEEMSKMMQNFCGGEGSFDCGAMMRKMYDDTPKEAEKEVEKSHVK